MFQIDKIGLWSANNEIVTALQLISPWPGYVKVDNRSTSEALLQDVIRYAEETFMGMEDNQKYLTIFVGKNDVKLKEILLQQDYQKQVSDMIRFNTCLIKRFRR